MNIPHPTTTCTVDYLERRSSYMATMPYQRNRPVKQRISDAAMHLSPATWFAPAILRAHDAHEYKKDRKRLDEQYAEYCLEKSRRRTGTLMRTDAVRRRGKEDGEGVPSVSTTPDTATRTGTMTSSTLSIPGGGRTSTTWVRSEISLPRARALEWACSTNVFSPGVFQEWMLLDGGGGGERGGGGGGGWDDADVYHQPALGPDPWALPPIESF